MSAHRGMLYTYTGKASFPEGAPDLKSIAVSLAREGRYAGAGSYFWPVALHTFVVCDMLPEELKIHGLLHDSPECITGDIPKPAKTDEIETFEEELLRSIYKDLDVRFPDQWEREAVKREDRKALRGEVYVVGTAALKEFNARCLEAEQLVRDYWRKYSYNDMLDANGAVQQDFINKFHAYKLMI